MAKVDTVRICLDGAEKNELDFKFDVNVGKDGTFSTTLPANIVTLLLNAGINLNKNRLNRRGYFEDNTLYGLKIKVSTACQDYVSKELIYEKIILRYAIDTRATYCFNREMEPVPNGNWTDGAFKEDYKKYGWQESTMQVDGGMNHSAFGILAYVQPYWKREYQYKSGRTKVFYEPIRDREAENIGFNIHWLSSLCGISAGGTKNLQEVEYTEDVALFFVDLIKSIFLLNHKIKDYLHPEAIKLLAENKVKLLGNG